MAKKKEDLGRGPWWVQNKAGDSFVWHSPAEIESGDLTVIDDESPMDRNGGFRSDEPANPVDPAVATEGEQL